MTSGVGSEVLPCELFGAVVSESELAVVVSAMLGDAVWSAAASAHAVMARALATSAEKNRVVDCTCGKASALASNVGDVQGEAEASLARTQDEGALDRAFEDEDVARGGTGRPERGKRWWSGH